MEHNCGVSCAGCARCQPDANTKRSYQPPIPKANNTPVFWDGDGFIQVLLAHQCPPWVLDTFPGHGACEKDAINLAVRYIRPVNRCRAGGRCPEGSQYASCVTFNKGFVYPDYTQAGFCITAGPQGGGRHQLAFVEKTLAVDKNLHDYYVAAAVWAQSDAPARATCDSWCKRCDKENEYCPDTDLTPIASGEYGECDCLCVTGSSAADFDRCTTVTEHVCSISFCGGHGTGAFTSVGYPGGSYEGTCVCTCDPGYYGRNCELRVGDPCDINDCNHKSYTTDGEFGGIRPNCQCSCGFGMYNFEGKVCNEWTFRSNPGGIYSSRSTNFTIQARQEDLPPGQVGEECRCSGNPLYNGTYCRHAYGANGGRVGCIGDSVYLEGPANMIGNQYRLECALDEEDSKYKCTPTDHKTSIGITPSPPPSPLPPPPSSSSSSSTDGHFTHSSSQPL
jgi:hypothetical protein